MLGRPGAQLRVAPLASALLLCASVAWGQEPGQSAAPAAAGPSAGPVVPRLINFSGTLKDSTGKPLTGDVTLTLSLYAAQEGGTPLWVETQNVQFDDQGRYSLLLGATEADGLPLDLFTSGEARWRSAPTARRGRAAAHPAGGCSLCIEGGRCGHAGRQTAFGLPHPNSSPSPQASAGPGNGSTAMEATARSGDARSHSEAEHYKPGENVVQ